MGWVGAIVTVVSLAVAVIIHYRYRIVSRPSFQTFSVVLIRREETLPSEVGVVYKGEPVDRVTKSYVVIWNAGTGTIKGEDVVSKDPIAIEVGSDGVILSSQVTGVTRPVTDFDITEDGSTPSNKVFCSFDFLDRGDGALVELLHTSENRQPTVRGTIRGIPEGITNRGQLMVDRKPLRNLDRMSTMAMLFFYVLLALVSLRVSSADYTGVHALISVLALAAILMKVWVLWKEFISRPPRFPTALLADRLPESARPSTTSTRVRSLRSRRGRALRS